MMHSLATRVIAVVLLLVVGTSCQQFGNSPGGSSIGGKTILGSMAGAAGGGLIAAAAGGGAAGIVGGVLLGGLLGGALGNRLDQKDKEMAAHNAQQTFESARTGETSTWQNPDSGHSGSVTPTRTYQAPSGEYCREYQQEVMIGGEKHQSYGTACRQPDGSWKIQNS